MSPILKRDIGEQLRHARKLATAMTGQASRDDGKWDEHDHGHDERHRQQYEYDQHLKHHIFDSSGTQALASSSARKGIGVGAEEDDPGLRRSWEGRTYVIDDGGMDHRDHPGMVENGLGRLSSSSSGWARAGTGEETKVYAKVRISGKGKGKERDVALTPDLQLDTDVYSDLQDGYEMDELECRGLDEDERHKMLRSSLDGLARHNANAHDIAIHAYGETSTSHQGRRIGIADWLRRELVVMGKSRMLDLRNLLLEATPSLLLNLVGEIFTGELLEHLARWRVFRRVDELFILVPMIGNLKGNLEMCLSARLGTSANIGELDSRRSRKQLLKANMTLLGMQALLIASLAAILSFGLGLFTTHRLGDEDYMEAVRNGTIIDPGLEVADQEWHEGYTRPGWKQLVMVLATAMGSAGMSSAVLGSFMSSLIVLSRWGGIDPDNITPPVASCLGDLLTLFILALLGSVLVGFMDTPVPLIAVLLMVVAAGWFTKTVMQDEWVKNVATGGWAPLIGAMLISSGTGMVLAQGVERYRGFPLLAIALTGLTGSIGAIHANRLSTSLHTNLHPKAVISHPNSHSHLHHSTHPPVPTASRGLTPAQSALTLFALSFPVMGCFYAFVLWAGWIDISLGWVGWAGYSLTVIISLAMAHYLTLFFWSKDLDPDSYTLPIHSALVDFIGQLLLMATYEICIWQGADVLVHVPASTSIGILG